jgi:hypothetical protein
VTRELTDAEFVEALRLCRLADAAAEAGQTPAGHYLGQLRDLLTPDAAGLDRAAADQAHRDDLARDVARLWAKHHERVRALSEQRVPGLFDALDLLATAYGLQP